MTPQIADLMGRIRVLESELDAELAKRRAELRIGLEHGRSRSRPNCCAAIANCGRSCCLTSSAPIPLIVLTAPVIYAGIVPFLLLDLFVSVYQAVCFPIYGIPKIKRGDYLVFDRHHLAYLNALEKLNCAYCSYANGLIAYTREIAARTEQYWCPIKHARRMVGSHSRYAMFDDYGNGDEYQAKLAELRKALAKGE
ncbi:MAG: hypothetical protein WDN48_10785 [Pseudolabrys sp.]